MKIPMFTLGQFTVLALLGLSFWLQSPVIACAVVVAMAVKEGREYLDSKKKNVEMLVLENKVGAFEEKVNRLQNELNRLVTRQSQYFGE